MDKHKILVVDDDQGICSMLCTYLEGKGYATDFALDGVSAPSKILTFKPELIVLDYMLPGADARTIFERLQKSEDTKDIPIIILTAIPIDHLRTYMPESPRLAYMSKPVDYVELDKKIHKFLGSSAAAGAPIAEQARVASDPDSDTPTIIDLDADQ